MVAFIPPLVLKRVLMPPPGKYSVMEGCQVVFLRLASASSSVISQKGFIVGLPSASDWSPVPSSAAGPELIKWSRPSAPWPSSL